MSGLTPDARTMIERARVEDVSVLGVAASFDRGMSRTEVHDVAMTTGKER